MSNLININESGRSTARNLYEFLELNPANFSHWCQRNIVNNKFSDEGIDYLRVVVYDETPTGGIVSRTDYELSIDFAKKLCMTSQTTRGEQARNYYISIEKQYNSKAIQVSPEQHFNMSLAGAKFAIEILRPSQASQIKMIETVHKNYGLPTNFLPSYTEESLTRSATALLSEHGKPMSIIVFNKRLMKLGILEEQQRKGIGSTVHKFKVLTDTGLIYGKNIVSTQNEREVQPHFYPEKFKDLLRMAVTA